MLWNYRIEKHVVTFDVHAKDAGSAGSQDHLGHLAGVGEDGLNAGKDVTGEWRKGTLGWPPREESG